MRQKKLSAAFWIKGFIVFLIIMFIFTLASRAAASFTVARVSVASPSSRKIQHAVSIEGKVEVNREISVVTQTDILVKSVLVNEGQRVKKGETLAVLDSESLKERIDNVEGEIRTLKLQNEDITENQNRAEEKRSRDIDRAREDYKQTREKYKALVSRAKKEWQTSEQELAKKQAELEQAKQALANIKEKYAGNMETKSEEISEYQAKVQDLEDDCSALQASAEEKKNAYEDMKETKKEEEKTAKRAVEDAKTEPDADSSVKGNNISVRSLESQLQKLKKLEKEKGQILASEDGVITSIITTAGQKTTDTAMFTMTDDSVGLKYVGQLPADDAEYVSVGDRITLRSADKEAEDIEVASLEPDESNEFLKLTAFLPADTFSLGETVASEIVQESENYDCTVPLTALRQDGNKYYVLVLEKESTVLGEQDVVRKSEVKVLDKNEYFAALESDQLDSESQIVTDTDRYVEAGDRVRLKEE